MLEGLERLFSLWGPSEWHLCGNESMERSGYGAEASDKSPIKVSKSQELLNLLATVRCRPFCYSANLSQVHLYFSRGYNEAQERDRFGMKHTFFVFDIQIVL